MRTRCGAGCCVNNCGGPLVDVLRALRQLLPGTGEPARPAWTLADDQRDYREQRIRFYALRQNLKALPQPRTPQPLPARLATDTGDSCNCKNYKTPWVFCGAHGWMQCPQ